MIVGLTSANRTYWASYGPCVVRRFNGTNNQAAALYIQFHEVIPNQLVSGTSVPRFKSFHAPSGTTPANGFDYVAENLSLTECTIAVSTTELVWTDPGANGGLDWTVEVDTITDAQSEKASVSGDLTTGVDNLTPWSDASSNATKRLLRVDFINNTGAARWLMLFANPVVGAGATPLLTLGDGRTTTTQQSFFFGHGRDVQSMDNQVATSGVETGGAIHYGCFLAQSSTQGTLTPTLTTNSCIRALYK